MIQSTFTDWMHLFLLEVILLTALGYWNCYVPESQKKKAEKYKNSAKRKGTCTILYHVRVSAIAEIILIIAAWAVLLWYGLVVKDLTTFGLFAIRQVVLAWVIRIIFLIIVFAVTFCVLLAAPFFGEGLALEWLSRYYLNEYGVFLEDARDAKLSD